MKNYIDNRRVLREEIAADVCEGTLSREDIGKIISDQQIKDSFIGDRFDSKTDKENWNERYLEKLPNYAVAESFNEDYLYYLADVSEYVRNKKKLENTNKWLLIVVVAMALIVIVTILILVSHSKK